MKNILLTLTVVGFLVGCGGGGGSTPSASSGQNGGSHQDGSQQQNSEDNLGAFEYPSGFNNFEDFQTTDLSYGVSQRSVDVEVAPIMVKGSISPQAWSEVLIQRSKSEDPELQRSHCEKGSAIGSNLTYIDDVNSEDFTSSSGVIEYTTSNGIMSEYVKAPDEVCSETGSFIDGRIEFDIDQKVIENPKSFDLHIIATFGTISEPFFIGSDTFNSSTGYKGTVEYTSDGTTTIVTSPFIEIFTVNSLINEPYTKGKYSKFNDVRYKDFSSKTYDDGTTLTKELSYIEEFTYKGREFVLYFDYKMSKINDEAIVNYDLTLKVPNDDSKTVVASFEKRFDTGIWKYTFTKDGKTQTKTIQ